MSVRVYITDNKSRGVERGIDEVHISDDNPREIIFCHLVSDDAEGVNISTFRCASYTVHTLCS